MKKGWQEKKLGDLCEKITKGSSPKWQGIKYVNEPGVLFITSENVGVNEIILNKKKYVEEKFNVSDKKSILQKGDVLTNIVGASIGRTAIFNLDDLANINQAVCILRCKEEILHNLYLSYLLNSPFFRDILHDNEVDNARANLSLGFFSNLAIPVPPLAEQHAIVEKLDESLAVLAIVKENAERNLVNARELFDSYVGNIFAKSSEEWEEKKLGDKNIIEIIDNDRGVNYPKKSDFHPEGYCLFMNTKNVRPDGFDFTTTMFITEKKDKALGKGKLSRNDVVMTTRGTIGNLGVYNDEVPFEQIRTNSGMLIFRPNLKYIVPEYLFEILRSGIIKAQITKHVSGAAQPQLPIKTLVNFTFPLPKSLAEQRAIVGRLKALSAETKRLEEIYQSKVEGLEELKKSVLGKAFAGEL